jgi:hypothetical protein
MPCQEVTVVLEFPPFQTTLYPPVISLLPQFLVAGVGKNKGGGIGIKTVLEGKLALCVTKIRGKQQFQEGIKARPQGIVL